MKSVSGTVIAGCAFTAIAVAVGTASANAASFESSDLMSAKDGGAMSALGAKEGGWVMFGKEAGAAPSEVLAVNAKEAGSSLVEMAKDGGATLEGLSANAKEAGSFVEMAKDGGATFVAYR